VRWREPLQQVAGPPEPKQSQGGTDEGQQNQELGK
jgi:hypothetical protein